MRLKALTLFSAALLAFGCQADGGQSGDFSGDTGDDGGETASGNGCKDTETPVDPGDDSMLGFSGEDVFAIVARSHSAPLVWQASDAVSYAPGAGETELTVAATATGDVWYVTSEPDPDQSGAEIAVQCPPPRLRVAVDLQVSTADGALAESIPAKVDAASASFAELSHDFELDEIAGSFAIEGTPPNGEVLGLGLEVALSPAGITGSLSSLLQITYPAEDPNESAVSAQPIVFATFPASASCPADQSGISGIPVAIDDEALGLSGEAALELYNDATPVTVRWLDGSESELTLTATSAGDGCVRQNPYAYLPGDPEAMVVYPVMLHAVSADGALDGTYTATLTTSPQQDGDEHRVVIEVNLPLELDQLADAGLEGVELPSGLHRLFYTLGSEVEGGAAHGQLELNGLTDPPCVTDPPEPDPNGMSTPGCEGTQVTELQSGSWGSGTVD